MSAIKEQMPGLLARVDDRWGLAWRVKNAIKEFSLTRSLKFARHYMRPPEYDRPVFILGVPRSGTTLMFHLLRTSSHFGCLEGGGTNMWRTYHHPRMSGWQSDHIRRGDVGFAEKRFIHAYLATRFTASRFVNKCPDNSLRVSYLQELFPDAIFVVIKRNPCDTISSLINGWRHPKGIFRTYYVPEKLSIPGYSSPRRWCFGLIEGWRQYKSSPIPEIAFAQWKQFTESIEDSKKIVEPSRWHEVYLEDLIASPETVSAEICRSIDVSLERALIDKAIELAASPVNALSPPRQEKWRQENEAEILDLLPRIASVKSGYIVDTDSGTCQIDRTACGAVPASAAV